MFKRLKKALVESFVGAIALGWLFAQGIIHFAYVFIGSLMAWIGKSQYFGSADDSMVPKGFLLENALREAAQSFGLLLLGYVLLRWLYFRPLEQKPPEPTSQV
jgi:hypothetical protein